MKIKKLHRDSKVPTQGSEYSAGYDLYAYSVEDAFAHLGNGVSEYLIQPGETVVVHTGICAQCDPGFFLGIFARSGLGIKSGIIPSNAVGVVDADFRGEIMVALYNHSNKPFSFKLSDRIAQMVQIPCVTGYIQVVDELDDTIRGAGGFGSTGK